MISLRLSIRSSEVIPLANTLNVMLGACEKIDYTDYYNIQYFCKQLFDKNFTLMNRNRGDRNKKPVTIQVNINIYRSIEHLYKYTLHKPDALYDVIIKDVVSQLDKQKVNLIQTV